MTKTTTPQPEITVGIDIGDKHCQLCFLDAKGEVIEESRIRTVEVALRERFDGRLPMLVVIEAGTHSPWISRLLGELGHKVLVANPRKLRLISNSNTKNDRNDAETLARAGRFDPTLLAPIEHRTEASQKDLEAVHARDQVVRMRTGLINHVRGVLKSIGSALPSGETNKFHEVVRKNVPEPLLASIEPLISVIQQTTEAINRYDKMVDELVATEYKETTRLTQVNGVGNLTGLAFMLSLGDPHRFKKSRDVGPYLGMQPRQDSSGKSTPELSITKAGDGFLRRLLVGSANYILGPFGKDSDLRRWGLQKAEGGKNAKKRAVVGVARKLSVLVHHLWVSGEIYEPLRNTAQSPTGKEAEVSAPAVAPSPVQPAKRPAQKAVTTMVPMTKLTRQTTIEATPR